MNKRSDRELLTLMKHDNQQAFSCLMDRYTEVLLRHIARRIKSNEDAVEILQDIFISLWDKRNTIQITTDSIYPYLFKAAKYEVIDSLVKAEKQIQKEQRLLPADVHAAVTLPVEDELIARELNELLYAAVDKMPETMKTIFYLSREKSLTVKQIAQSLSLSEQTVKNNLTSALKRLRFTLSREHYLAIATAIVSRLLS